MHSSWIELKNSLTVLGDEDIGISIIVLYVQQKISYSLGINIEPTRSSLQYVRDYGRINEYMSQATQIHIIKSNPHKNGRSRHICGQMRMPLRSLATISILSVFRMSLSKFLLNKEFEL